MIFFDDKKRNFLEAAAFLFSAAVAVWLLVNAAVFWCFLFFFF
ncbi:hypothetical protein STRDD11_01491 [Streptococcus sp. DD11]|nr:hypothetical protein STRDD11_01491 [Streptococcus sp. DD11]